MHLNTPLHDAARCGNLRDLRTLVKSGIPIDIKNNNGETPLNLALSNHNVACAKYLCKRGANVNEVDTYSGGDTSLHYAARIGNLELITVLVVSGAAINVKNNFGSTPLHSLTNNIDCATYLLSNGALTDAQRSDGSTPLHLAAYRGTNEYIQLLLHHTINPNIKDNYGRTPLHQACQANKANLVKLLLEAGADVNIRDTFGFTPLHFAAQQQQTDCVKVLLESKANADIPNNYGEYPKDIASPEICLVIDILTSTHR